MQRFARVLAVILLTCFALALIGCGSGSSTSNPNKNVASIKISPSPISLNRGDVLLIAATAKDTSGNTTSANFTYSSSNNNLASISSAGNICAGQWDSTFVTCTKATTPGKATITVNAGTASQTVDVFVHEQVDSVQIQGQAPGSCISYGGSAIQLSAKAFSNDPAVCGATPAPCQIDSSTLGNFTFNAVNSGVVTIDNTTNIGSAAPGNPGTTGVFATIGSAKPVNSSTVPFTTCPIASITIGLQNGSGNTFAINTAATQNLTATITDTQGVNINANVISVLTPESGVASVGAAGTLIYTVTGTVPGTANILGICSPPTCNVGLFPVYSNIITGTVNGTSTGTVYAGSTSSTSLVPIDIATNAAGTAITLPRAPNSMRIALNGATLVMGADTGGGMLLNTGTNSVTSVTPNGKVLAVSEDGNHTVFSDSAGGVVTIVNLSTGSIEGSLGVVGGARSANFSPDSQTAYISTGTKLLVFSTSNPLRQITTPALDGAFLQSAPIGYVAQPGAIGTRELCDENQIASLPATNPNIIRPIPDGTGLLSVDSPSIEKITVTGAGSGCPINPLPTQSIVANDLTLGSITPVDLIVSQKSDRAYVLANTSKIGVYDISSTTVQTPLTLSASANSTTGGLTFDGANLYVGGSDGTVHHITISNGQDATIAVNLKKSDNSAAIPDLVAVRSK